MDSQRVGFYGVAFKEGTDDLRESALLRLLDSVQEFAVVQVFDEIISTNARALDMLGRNMIAGSSENRYLTVLNT